MLTLHLDAPIEARLEEKARADGVDLPTYAGRVLAREAGPTPAAAEPTAAEDDRAKAERQHAAIKAFIADATAWAHENLPPGYYADDDRGTMYDEERGGDPL